MDRKALAVCFLGIFVSYLVYGILQENITKSRYGEHNERFTFTVAMVFVQCIVNALFAQMALMMSRPNNDTSPQKLYAVMAFSYVGAMLASNHALQFVSYPTQVLGKSIKPIPVMILGVILARKRYTWYKYLFVMLITVGVALFMYKPSASKAGSQSDEHVVGFGELLLLISLALDGVTGGIQDKLRAEHRTHTHRMMLWMNLWSVLYLGISLVTTSEGVDFLVFVTKYPWVMVQLITFSICSAIGQNFIFMTITKFGPLTCSVITTTRKFFTILGSVLIFSHPLSLLQWCGTIFVFAGLSLDSVYGKDRPTTKRSVTVTSNGVKESKDSDNEASTSNVPERAEISTRPVRKAH